MTLIMLGAFVLALLMLAAPRRSGNVQPPIIESAHVERNSRFEVQSLVAAAEKLINGCGYNRRDEELADAKAAILSR